MSEVASPTFTETVDQSVFLEPLGGPQDPVSSLDRFPDKLYNKSTETHFIRFMYSLLGPAGVGWIKQQYLEAKLALYAQGFSAFNIEKYYGDPFQFGRILEEELPEDPEGLLTREEWEKIKVRDESYRSRAITFFNAVRSGGTPEGMTLAAESGLNHSAFIVENYKYLFDIHSDQPLGLPYYGRTLALEEFIVIPRQDTSQSEQQVISFAESTAKEGSFNFTYNGESTTFLPYNASQFEVEGALTSLTQIGKEGLTVSGGPNPNPFIITFRGPLSNRQVPTLEVASKLLNNLGQPIPIYVRVMVGGVKPVEEKVVLSDEYQHNAQTAIDYLRPLASLPTSYSGRGNRTRQEFKAVHSSSNYTEAIKFVTGSKSVKWPEPDAINWIEAGKENESKRIEGDLQAHYVSYHSISNVRAYTGEALEDPDYDELLSVLEGYKTEHIGRFDPRSNAAFPFLLTLVDDNLVLGSKNAIPPCSIPMEITSNVEREVLIPLIEGSLHASAIEEDGTGKIGQEAINWWSSLERDAPLSEVLEIDLGETRVVNWMSFEITRKPFYVELDYDRKDVVINVNETVVNDVQPREFIPVTLWAGFESTAPPEDVATVIYDTTQPAWQQFKIFFRDQNQHNIGTRFLRLIFKRPSESALGELPYSADVRNLRVGRYAGASPTWQSV